MTENQQIATQSHKGEVLFIDPPAIKPDIRNLKMMRDFSFGSHSKNLFLRWYRHTVTDHPHSSVALRF